MSKNEKGFSLIELLLVVVIIGVIAALAVPAFQKGIWAAENGNAFAAMRTLSSTQVGFFSQNSRFGNLAEVNRIIGGGIGTEVGDRLVRGKYVFEMAPLVPTPDELRTDFKIVATRAVPGEITYQYELSQTGEIIQIQP
jgi:prepilin-type N-terminal cleavage/methylation domain